MHSINPTAIRQGDRLALSRALTAIENNTAESRLIQTALFPFSGHAHLIGITGSPGTGKSTLTNQIAKALRRGDQPGQRPKVAIIAVDPTSPFTGGALLGDRIRMQDLAGDKDVFIRSMASRGALGGIAHTTASFATILDSAGFDLILIETVGAGQSEVEIANLAHTVIVVEAPGFGDEIQAIKAGILEIADILVVNKADQPGADNATRALEAMLAMAGQGKNQQPLVGKHIRLGLPAERASSSAQSLEWKVPVLQVTATEGQGIEPLVNQIKAHRSYLQRSGLWQVKEASRLQLDLEALIKDTLMTQWAATLDQKKFDTILNDLLQRKCSPLEAIELLVPAAGK